MPWLYTMLPSITDRKGYTQITGTAWIGSGKVSRMTKCWRYNVAKVQRQKDKIYRVAGLTEVTGLNGGRVKE